MNSKQGTAGYFALLIGAFLLIDGIWGMFSTHTFGILTTNKMHAASHLVLGSLGIYTGLTRNARIWCLIYGPIVLLVGILRFVPGVRDMIIEMMNINYAFAIFNIVAGTAAIVVARTAQTINKT
ncbi:MAG: DUF4383 domain-containing protein [Gemmatimonadaceae bacterium]